MLPGSGGLRVRTTRHRLTAPLRRWTGGPASLGSRRTGRPSPTLRARRHQVPTGKDAFLATVACDGLRESPAVAIIARAIRRASRHEPDRLNPRRSRRCRGATREDVVPDGVVADLLHREVRTPSHSTSMARRGARRPLRPARAARSLTKGGDACSRSSCRSAVVGVEAHRVESRRAPRARSRRGTSARTEPRVREFLFERAVADHATREIGCSPPGVDRVSCTSTSGIGASASVPSWKLTASQESPSRVRESHRRTGFGTPRIR